MKKPKKAKVINWGGARINSGPKKSTEPKSPITVEILTSTKERFLQNKIKSGKNWNDYISYLLDLEAKNQT
jgi:hypothetical protein